MRLEEACLTVVDGLHLNATRCIVLERPEGDLGARRVLACNVEQTERQHQVNHRTVRSSATEQRAELNERREWHDDARIPTDRTARSSR